MTQLQLSYHLQLSKLGPRTTPQRVYLSRFASSLQVQQALLEQQWAPTICYNDAWEGANASSGAAEPPLLLHSPAEASLAATAAAAGTPAVRPAPSEHSNGGATAPVHPAAAWDQHQYRQYKQQQYKQYGSIDARSSLDQHSVSWRSGSPTSADSMYSDTVSSAGSTTAARQYRHAVRQRQQQGVLSEQDQELFRGLRVRMGVATGFVGKRRSVKNSEVYRTAQGKWSAVGTLFGPSAGTCLIPCALLA